MAIDIIGDTWKDVMQQCLNGVWKAIWPSVGNDFQCFAADEFISDARHEIIEMAKSVGFQQADEENVADLLNSHREELSNGDLLELDRECHEEKEPMEENERPSPQVLMMKGMTDAFKLLDGYLAFFDKNDPNRERSAKVARLMKEANACYTELFREKQHCPMKSSLNKFFRKQDSSISTQSTNSQPSTSGREISLPSFDVFDLDEDSAPH
ncbi:hypothetical protein Y1Q_0008816 [Alligator mississippiensis]|uniref:Uncharacterized protein n=1 Tax=Alligator mississippiensis TaxID=8496 RepID=A0A151NA42_ALLMI|nr:hypothetical protein Y1Q_0008816 [Alligator mississippiensis]